MVRIVGPGGDEADANERLNWQMLMLRSVVAHDNRVSVPEIARPGSELLADDEATAPFHTSHLVHYALNVSSDALRTALVVLADGQDIRVPIIGLYPLLRTVIEGSALATWLVAPDERLVRVKRTLEARLSDLSHDDRAVVVASTPELTDDAAERSAKQKMRRENSTRVRSEKRRLLDHAARLGVEVDERGMPGFGPILETIAPVIGMSVGEVRGAWHFVSGLTHPSLSRAISMASVEVKENNEGGILTATMSADLATVGLALDAALLGFKTALDVVAVRGGQEDLAWTGDDLPPAPRFQRVWNDR